VAEIVVVGADIVGLPTAWQLVHVGRPLLDHKPRLVAQQAAAMPPNSPAGGFK